MTPTPAEIEYYAASLLNICAGCYKTLNNTKTVCVDRVDHVVCEEKIMCGHCGAQVDYWAYGNWEGEHYRKTFEHSHPKAAELIQRLTGVK